MPRTLAISSGQQNTPQQRFFTFSVKLLPLMANEQGAHSRVEIVDNVQYLVIPTVAVLETVLNGILLPAQEILKWPEAWEGVPVPVGHPVDADGWYASAKTRGQLSKCAGWFFDISVTSDKAKLVGDIWIELDRAYKLGGNVERAVSQLRNGHSAEVSTAFFADIEMVMGSYNSVEYFGIFRNIVPDHLAILLDEKGACNWQDGCGCPRANQEVDTGQVVYNVLGKARRPSYSGTESTSWGSVTKSFTAYRDGYYKNTGTAKPDDVPGSVESAPSGMKRWIAGKSLLGDPSADSFNDLLFFPVVNPGTDKLNEGALLAVHGGRGQQADIPASAYESADSIAVSLLNSEFDRDLETNTEGSINMERQGMIDALIACQCCELTAEQLAELPDETLTTMHTMTVNFASVLEAHQQEQGNADPEPTAGADPGPVVNVSNTDIPPIANTNQQDSILQEVIDQFGGAEQFRSAMGKVKANADAERESLAKSVLAVNKDFTKDELEAMDIDTLRKLAVALVGNVGELDFSGVAMPRVHSTEAQELPMPEVDYQVSDRSTQVI